MMRLHFWSDRQTKVDHVMFGALYVELNETEPFQLCLYQAAGLA